MFFPNMSFPNMSCRLIRGFTVVFTLVLGAVLVCTSPASARRRHKEPAKTEQPTPADTKNAGKPSQLASYGDWGVFLAQGDKSKTCYALASPKDRAPSGLKRDPAYVFISNRPGEKVRGEVSIIMGFSVKDGAAAHADIGGTGFDLVTKGANAWIKNQAQEPQFVDALKKGSKLIVKAPSSKGRLTIDSYSLAGLAQALDRIEKECP
ncbi:MAG TPA: invasion associated locus B family protein [Methylocella sp.]